MILWNSSRRYRSSGSWNGQIFSLVPEMTHNNIFEYKFILNDNESYFSYWVYNTSGLKISGFVMDVSGQIKQLTWVPNKGWSLFWSQPRNQREVYAFCGAYGTVPKDVSRQFGRLASNHGHGSLIQKLERSRPDRNKQG